MSGKEQTPTNNASTTTETTSTTDTSQTPAEGIQANQTESSNQSTEQVTPQETSDSSVDGGILAATEESEETQDNTDEAPEKPEDNAPSEPEPYELTLSDESPLSDAEFESIVNLAENLSLSKEQAESLIAMQEQVHNNAMQAATTKVQADLVALRDAYVKEPELNNPTAKLALKAAVSAFDGNENFKQIFADPAMNYNIPMAKFLVEVGKRIRSDLNGMPSPGKGSTGANSSAGVDPFTEMANKFYKNM